MNYPRAVGRQSGAVRPSPVFLLVVVIAAVGGALAWDAELNSQMAKLGVFILVVAGWIVTVCLHEFAHAFVAWRAGDREVEMRGYLTLNPLKYSHPLLSIALPVLFIAIGGFALPGGAVYVHSHNFSPRTQRILSGAGPAVNAVLAVVMLAIVRLWGSGESHAAFWYGLSYLAFLQITATVLNLIPVPGTDGYGILEPSLSYQTRRALDQIKPYGILILVALLFTPELNRLFFDFIDTLFRLSGLPQDPYSWWQYGSSLTRFWR